MRRLSWICCGAFPLLALLALASFDVRVHSLLLALGAQLMDIALHFWERCTPPGGWAAGPLGQSWSTVWELGMCVTMYSKGKGLKTGHRLILDGPLSPSFNLFGLFFFFSSLWNRRPQSRILRFASWHGITSLFYNPPGAWQKLRAQVPVASKVKESHSEIRLFIC